MNISSTTDFFIIIINLPFRIGQHFKGQLSAEKQVENKQIKKAKGSKTEGHIIKIFLMEFIYSAIEILTKISLTRRLTNTNILGIQKGNTKV